MEKKLYLLRKTDVETDDQDYLTFASIEEAVSYSSEHYADNLPEIFEATYKSIGKFRNEINAISVSAKKKVKKV